MLRWALRSLFDEKAALFTSAAGVSAAFLLALVLQAIFAGEAEKIVVYPAHTDADVWVMQHDVANMHMATSLVESRQAPAIAKVEGVATVTPILYVNTFVEAGGQDWFSYVVGLPPNAQRGGPWLMARGKARPGLGEIILSDILARRAGIDLGATVRIDKREFIVTGLSRGTYSMANSLTFVSYADLAELLSAPTDASYFLVKAAPGSDAKHLARRIVAQLPELNALTRDELIDNDRQLALQMGVEIVRMMNWIASGVAALVIAFTIYSSVVRRTVELGVAKAIGAGNTHLYSAVLLQTAIIAVAGYGAATLATFGLEPTLHAFVPEVSLLFSGRSVSGLMAAAVVVMVVSAIVPARRIARIDPASAFRV
jgi:putative ABC transport system permease protein